MARYLFCWELGQGLGHLVRYQGLIEKLISRGHEVYYLARDEQRVRQVNPQAALIVEEIQPDFLPKNKRIQQPANASPATLLLNCGFYSAERLGARAKVWIEYLRAIRPTCIIADHSPTAIFANRFLSFPLVIVGDGFAVPPVEKPFRLFQYWRFQASDESIHFENQLTEILNEATAIIDNKAHRFSHPSELFTGDQRWLATFPELDCYGPRVQGDYIGTFPQHGFGDNFEWPNTSGPRVFAYISHPQALDQLADWASNTDVSLCLYGRNLPQALLNRFSRAHIAQRPVNFAQVLHDADLAITQGTANSIANFALAGIPQLALPISIENLMESRRLEILGCGLVSMADEFNRFSTKANALITDRGFRRAAIKLHNKYKNQDFESQSEKLYKKLMAL